MDKPVVRRSHCLCDRCAIVLPITSATPAPSTTPPYRHPHRVVVVRFHSIVIANVNKLFMRHINCPALWQRRLWPQCVCVCICEREREWGRETDCVYASDYLCQMAVNWISMFAVLTHTLPLSPPLPSSFSLSLHWTCSPRLLFILIISWCQLILSLSFSRCRWVHNAKSVEYS